MSSSTAISNINGPYQYASTNNSMGSTITTVGNTAIWPITYTPTITILPSTITNTSSTTYQYPGSKKVYSMKSPRKDAPHKAFIDGRLLCIGLIGSRGTEYTFMNGKILFCNVMPYGHISLEFRDEIYHYLCEFDEKGMVPRLISVVKTGS